MKVRMKMADLNYSDGFPANIETSETVVVQIQKGNKQGVVLYVCKETGRQDRCYLPLELNKQFNEGLYIINPE